MYKQYSWLIILAILAILMTIMVPFTIAQECPTIVQDAITIMDTACRDTERNQACYGNGQIDVLTQPDITLGNFDAPGDQIAIAGIQTMTLYPLDEIANNWGVALMQIQANLPDTVPGQNVTVLVFGDTEITSASANMDAFYFRGGVGEAGCAQAPNGIVIQTPEGAGMIDLTINDIQISLGSTAYITAEVEDLLTFNLLEGDASVTADGETQSIAGGEFVAVPLDENLSATGAPSEPEAIDFASLPILPVALLPQDISEEVPDLPTASADNTTASGEVIIPATGNWTYTLNGLTTSNGCPAGFGEMMQSNIQLGDTTFVDFGGQPINLETLLENTGGVFATYENPEPNIYQASFSQDGGTFLYQLQVVSETQITGFFEIDIATSGIACTITMNYSVELSE